MNVTQSLRFLDRNGSGNFESNELSMRSRRIVDRNRDGKATTSEARMAFDKVERTGSASAKQLVAAVDFARAELQPLDAERTRTAAALENAVKVATHFSPNAGERTAIGVGATGVLLTVLALAQPVAWPLLLAMALCYLIAAIGVVSSFKLDESKMKPGVRDAAESARQAAELAELKHQAAWEALIKKG